MTKKYYCERVDQGFIDNAPFRNTVDLAVTPEQVFEVLADAESWPQLVTVDHQGDLRTRGRAAVSRSCRRASSEPSIRLSPAANQRQRRQPQPPRPALRPLMQQRQRRVRQRHPGRL